MKKYLLLSAIVTSMLFILNCNSCGDGGGGGAEPPASNLDKIVWVQQQAVSTTSGGSVTESLTPLQVGINATKDVDGTTLAGTSYKSNIYSASLVDQTKILKLSPELGAGISGQPLGLASNGDFWFFTNFGIFVSNVNSANPKPRPIISAQQMAKDYVDSPDAAAVYKLNTLKPSLVTVPYKDDPKNYRAYISYEVVKYSSNATTYFYVSLKYDSKDGSIKKFLPFYGDTNCSQSTCVSYYLAGSPYFIKTPDLYYYIYITNNAEDSSTSDTSYFIIKYDADLDKHFLYSLRMSGNCTLNDNKCREFDNTATTNTQVSCSADVVNKDQLTAKKSVEECLTNAVKGQDIPVYDYDTLNEDVTALVASRAEVVKLMDLKGKETKTTVTTLAASNLVYFGGNVTCNDQKCSYDGYASVFPRDVRYSKSYTYFEGGSFDPEGNYLNTLYRQNNADGTVTVVDTAKRPDGIDVKAIATDTQGDGDVLFYGKYTETPIERANSPQVTSSNKADDNLVPSPVTSTAYYLYSSNSGKSVKVFSSSDKMYEGKFKEMFNGQIRSLSGLTSDGKYLMILSLDDKGVSTAKYVNVSDFISGKDQTIITALDGVNISTATSSTSPTQMLLWKGYAVWFTEDGVYVNKPFEKDKTAKKIDQTGSKSIGGALTVAEVVPPEDIGFDISVDFTKEFACGGATAFSSYCSGAYEMCETGADGTTKTCVTKYTPPPVGCTLDSDCDAGYRCNSGLCEIIPASCSIDADCTAAKNICKDGACTEVECKVDTDCTNGTCQDYACVVNQLTINECNSSSPCEVGFKCVEGAVDHDGGGSKFAGSANLCIPMITKFLVDPPPYKTQIFSNQISFTLVVGWETPDCSGTASGYWICAQDGNTGTEYISVDTKDFPTYHLANTTLNVLNIKPKKTSFTIKMPADVEQATITVSAKIASDYGQKQDIILPATLSIPISNTTDHCMLQNCTKCLCQNPPPAGSGAYLNQYFCDKAKHECVPMKDIITPKVDDTFMFQHQISPKLKKVPPLN